MDVSGDGHVPFWLEQETLSSDVRRLLESAAETQRRSEDRLREVKEAQRTSAARLRNAENAHRTSAAQLWQVGKEGRARRAEQRAAWAHLLQDQPEVSRRLHAAKRDLDGISQLEQLLDKVLDAALSLFGADRGNIQILDPATSSLRIAAQRGFGTEFLDYFAAVDDDRPACGRAAKERVQTVIEDVNTDSGFAVHRDIAAASGFRAVQSTPLIDQADWLVGVFSTHYPKPYHPPESDLQIMQRFGEIAGQAIMNHLSVSSAALAGGSPLGGSSAGDLPGMGFAS